MAIEHYFVYPIAKTVYGFFKKKYADHKQKQAELKKKQQAREAFERLPSPEKTKEAQLQLKIAASLIKSASDKKTPPGTSSLHTKQAAEAVAKARKLDPTVTYDEVRDGESYHYTVDSAAAICLYMEAVDRFNDVCSRTDPEKDFSRYDKLMNSSVKQWIFQYKDDCKKVIATLDKALAYQKGAQIYTLKAKALNRFGRKEEARATIREGFALFPDNEKILQTMGEIG